MQDHKPAFQNNKKNIISYILFQFNNSHSHLTLQTWAALLLSKAAQQYPQTGRQVIIGLGVELPERQERTQRNQFFFF